MTAINFKLRLNVAVAFETPEDTSPELTEVIHAILSHPHFANLCAPSVYEETATYLQRKVKAALPFAKILEDDAAHFRLSPEARRWFDQQIKNDGSGLDALMGAMVIDVQGLEQRVSIGRDPQPLRPSWWLRLKNAVS